MADFSIDQIDSVHESCEMHTIELLSENTNTGVHSYSLFNSLNEGIIFHTNKEKLFLTREKYYNAIISVTIFNEDIKSLEYTLSGIFANRTFKSYRSQVLMKTLLIIISDGYKHLSESIKAKLES